MDSTEVTVASTAKKRREGTVVEMFGPRLELEQSQFAAARHETPADACS